ncbi:MAG: hypothetical protein ACE5JQ_15465, partial [Candidatus Methylomirabilales bacterium]
MWKQDLIRKLVVSAPHDLLEAIYARGLRREGPSWAEIVREAQALGIFTAEEAAACLQLANREGAVNNSRSQNDVREEHPAEGPMQLLEQGMSDMTELIDRYSREIHTISGEVLGRGHEASVEEFRDRVAEVQDRMHREACEMYDRLVAESREFERELMANLTRMRETMERAALLKEIVISAVKPGG